MRARTSFVLCGLLALTTGASCGSGSKPKVDVVEANSSIAVGAGQVRPGKVTFRIRNTGTYAHELVVVRAGSVRVLPLVPNGEVDEGAIPAADRVGRIDYIAPGATRELGVTLGAGRYVLFCNRTDGTDKVHFAAGEHTDLTVAG